MTESTFILASTDADGRLVPLPLDHPSVDHVRDALAFYGQPLEEPPTTAERIAAQDKEVLQVASDTFARFTDPRVRVLAQAAEDFAGLGVDVEWDDERNRVTLGLLDADGVVWKDITVHPADAFTGLVTLVRSSGRQMLGYWDY
jgi:hypothetical protein